jgi:lysozyme
LGLDPDGSQISDAMTGVAHKIGNALSNAYQSTSNGLASMVAGFEGHARNGYGVYRDIAGNLTAGFGHLVRPGENFSHLNRAGALALLSKDLGNAIATVTRLVHVHLSRNQLGALADFEFNVGERNFSRSTLLRLLNAGNYAGAANQFQYWNHALVHGHMVTLAALSERRAAEAQLFRTQDRAVVVQQKNNYQVTSTDPQGAATEIERRQQRMTADLVRNLSGAAVQ